MTNDVTRQTRADAFVVFGISGDLARVMTFRSLYRLEARRRGSGRRRGLARSLAERVTGT